MSKTTDEIKNTDQETTELEAIIPNPNADGIEKVQIKLFYDGDKYKDDVTVAVNGKTYTIKRGVPVEVPKYVAEVLENHEMQEKASAAYKSAQIEAYAATIR